MELYRVLLVDDEEDIREGISRKMDWLGLGFSLVGQAANGQDALELAESLHRSAVRDSSSKFWTDRVDKAFLLSLPI